jgi:hypothetical protein
MSVHPSSAQFKERVLVVHGELSDVLDMLAEEIHKSRRMTAYAAGMLSVRRSRSAA